jgi:hypothetical protein
MSCVYILNKFYNKHTAIDKIILRMYKLRMHVNLRKCLKGGFLIKALIVLGFI